MAGLIRVLACLVLLVGTAGAFSAVGAAGDVVVAVFSTPDDLAPHLHPVLRESCAPRLRILKKAGFKITNVQGGGGLLYTLESEGHKGGVVIVGCVPLPEETTPSDNPT